MMDPDDYPYAQKTAGIIVRVAPLYLDDESNPSANRYVWAYQVEIENDSAHEVQLISRHWIITDANGEVEEVIGDGVVGEQPRLAPGARFEYVSGCPLGTPSGFMGGTYTLRGAQGETFKVAIPTFSLDSPHASSTIN